MKNIHILPTDKPSRLYKNINNELSFTDVEFEQKINGFNINQNIYITSNEEIKEGDWFICGEEILKCTGSYSLTQTSYVKCHKGDCSSEICKKIILTTDQELIKDGVQSIDDEFLEWFVKNPSCEWVKTQLNLPWESSKDEYEIIIPKDEQKQHIIDMMNNDEYLGLYNETFDEYLIRLKDRRTEDNYDYYTDEELELYNDYIMDCWRCGMSVYKCLEFMYFAEKEIQPEEIWNEEKMEGVKQLIQDNREEILEEFIRKAYLSRLEDCLPVDFEDGVKLGVKYQQEQNQKEIKLLQEEINYLKRNKI